MAKDLNEIRRELADLVKRRTELAVSLLLDFFRSYFMLSVYNPSVHFKPFSV